MKEINKNKKPRKDRWLAKYSTTKAEPIVNTTKIGNKLWCATKHKLYVIVCEEEEDYL